MKLKKACKLEIGSSLLWRRTGERLLAEAEDVVVVVTTWLGVVVFVFEVKVCKLFGYCSFAAHRFRHFRDRSLPWNVVALVSLELDPILHLE